MSLYKIADSLRCWPGMQCALYSVLLLEESSHSESLPLLHLGKTLPKYLLSFQWYPDCPMHAVHRCVCQWSSELYVQTELIAKKSLEHTASTRAAAVYLVGLIFHRQNTKKEKKKTNTKMYPCMFNWVISFLPCSQFFPCATHHCFKLFTRLFALLFRSFSSRNSFRGQHIQRETKSRR